MDKAITSLILGVIDITREFIKLAIVDPLKYLWSMGWNMNELREYVFLKSKIENEIKQLSNLQRKGLEDLLDNLKLDKDVYFRPDSKSPLLRGRILIRSSQSMNGLDPWHFTFYPYCDDGKLTQLGGQCYFAPDRLVKAVERGEIREAKE